MCEPGQRMVGVQKNLILMAEVVGWVEEGEGY